MLPYLKDAKQETEHLRKIANMCVRYLLPKDYYRTPLKLFLREVLATKGKSNLRLTVLTKC